MLNQKISGMVRLFRPELPFAAGLCVVAGEVLALGKIPPARESILGFVCGFFISGAAIVLNDYFDLEVDRVNAADRPLPAGVISPGEAILLAVLATLIGLAASLAIGIPAFIFCVILWGIGFLYNWKFKAAGLLGNLMVSSSVAATFILGGIMAGEPWNKLVWVFGAMAFFIDLGEEIAGDAMDMEGDKQRDSKSIAILRGKKFALRLSGSLFGLVVLISFVPVLFQWLGTSYLIMISVTDILIVLCVVRLLKTKTPEEGRRVMRWIYLGELLGLMAFVFGQFIV
ncbi:MAG: UbiA family prenyltransferase [Chloroflexota bacterium]